MGFGWLGSRLKYELCISAKRVHVCLLFNTVKPQYIIKHNGKSFPLYMHMLGSVKSIIWKAFEKFIALLLNKTNSNFMEEFQITKS